MKIKSLLSQRDKDQSRLSAPETSEQEGSGSEMQDVAGPREAPDGTGRDIVLNETGKKKTKIKML